MASWFLDLLKYEGIEDICSPLRTYNSGEWRIMATNYIGAFCLTNLLLPLLKNSPVPSQIVNVTFFYSSKWLTRKLFRGSASQEQNHIHVLVFMRILNCCGSRSSGNQYYARKVPSCLSCVAFTILKLLGLLQSPKKGVSSVLDAALAQPDISGVYLFSGKGRTINSSALPHNSKLAHEPWTTSCNLFMQS